MTLVQNHLQPLSGNRYLFVFLIFSLLLSACSPKVIQRTTVKPSENGNVSQNSKNKTDQEADNQKITTEKVTRKKSNESSLKMSILLPLKSHTIQIATASKSELQNLDVSIDFYQGFMLGLKENLNNNIKLDIQILDTEDNPLVIKRFQNNGDLNKDLILGPLYPNAIQQITPYVKENHILMVSPLSAASPAVFQNKELVSMMPNIAVHADKLLDDAQKDVDKGSPPNFYLINPKDGESEIFAKEIRAYFQKYFPNFVLKEIQSPQQIAALKSNGSSFCMFVASATRAKTVPILNALGKFRDLNTTTAVKVYGHPNWVKQGYSNHILNKLNIHYTVASYHMNQVSKSSVFETKYKAQYTLSPSDYAYMGYDMGSFLAKCFNETPQIPLYSALNQVKFKGLGSNFDLAFHPQFGFVNLALRLIEFRNNQLIVK